MVLLLHMILSSDIMLWYAQMVWLVAYWFYPRHTVTKQYIGLLSATLFKQHNRCATTIWTFRAWVNGPSRALKHYNKWYDFAELRDWQYNCVCLLHIIALFVLSALSTLFALCVVCVCFYTLCKNHVVSGRRGHRHCLWVSPAQLGRPDPLSFKWIGRQFEWGLARRVVK